MELSEMQTDEPEEKLCQRCSMPLTSDKDGELFHVQCAEHQIVELVAEMEVLRAEKRQVQAEFKGYLADMKRDYPLQPDGKIDFFKLAGDICNPVRKVGGM